MFLFLLLINEIKCDNNIEVTQPEQLDLDSDEVGTTMLT